MAHASPISDVREAKLFRNNRSQAVRIPVEFEMPGTKVLIRKEGSRLIIEPEARPDLVSVLRSLSPLGADDDFPTDLDASLAPLKPINL